MNFVMKSCSNIRKLAKKKKNERVESSLFIGNF